MRKLAGGVVIYLGAMMAIISCGEEDDSTTTPTSTLKYADVSSLINTNCATSGCHAASTKAGGVDLSSYSAVASNAATSATEMEKGDMPTPGSTADTNLKDNPTDKAKLLEYFKAGAPE